MEKINNRIRGVHKVSFSKVVNIASTEYVKWIFNPRLIVFVSMYLFMYDYIIRELIVGIDKMECHAINIFEPFIAMANNSLVNLIIPAVFIVLMSDFPKTDGNTMFYIQRVGKLNWMWGQLLFSFMSIITYMTSIAYISFLIIGNKAYSRDVWSDLTTDYVQKFPQEKATLIANMINGRLYNNVTPIRAFIHTFLLSSLFLMLVAMILLAGFSAGKRVLSMGIVSAVIAIGSGLIQTDGKVKWLFPSANSMLEIHFDKILRERVVGLDISYLYFIGLIVILFVIACLAIRRYDFAKITDMED